MLAPVRPTIVGGQFRVNNRDCKHIAVIARARKCHDKPKTRFGENIFRENHHFISPDDRGFFLDYSVK